MSEKVGGHSLPNGTPTTDNKYMAQNGCWLSTVGVVPNHDDKETLLINALPQAKNAVGPIALLHPPHLERLITVHTDITCIAVNTDSVTN
ncbi:hypothetical protein PROFUN_09730 [Planoprotostelium fungivorum]|uniref:Uncharacterized protein n=1 Tax=Planoprotostelium fungivorum TaxID=1890364 RepID=A0A2P6NET9_9EUKA|nr:hypothetical protein PROFUN_09730 [Planoprotostelium fungivorum]